MLLAEEKEAQLKHIDDVITNEEYWYKDKFRLLNNEAGSGKSIQAFKSIARLATTTNYKIVYVQMFANENSDIKDAIELKNTVDKINKYAGKKVAKYMCSENKDKHKEILKDAQVICITHRKYSELCKKKDTSFVTDSDVLILDEFLNLFEDFYISEIELSKLIGFSALVHDEQDKKNIKELYEFLKNIIIKLKNRNGNEMRIVNLQKLDIKKHLKTLDTIIKNTKDNEIPYKEIIEIAQKIKELFSHSSLFDNEKIGKKSYPVLCGFYDIDYILAKKNNIILDANGGFDGRYKLRKDFFKLDYQKKVFNYSDSYINFYPIATTKTALNSYKNIILNIDEYIESIKESSFGFRNKETLIVTDVARENQLTPFQKQALNVKNIEIAHFGNLIGKNEWKDFNDIWITKTPFYTWREYILMYMFYGKKDLNGNTNCGYKTVKGKYNNYTIFRNEEFNKLKNSIVKGEIYQAMKRIARDGRQCTFNILTADEDIYNDVAKEFKGIHQTVKLDLKIEKANKTKHKNSGRKPVKSNKRNEEIKEYLLKAKNEGKQKIAKSDLCDIASIRKDKLSKQLNNISNFLRENDLIVGTGKEQGYIFLGLP